MSRRHIPAILAIFAIVALFVWFNAGSNTFRSLDWAKIAKHPSSILWPPWNLPRIYVSRDGDEHLYFEYSRLILGEQADLRYIASKRQGNAEANLRQLESLVSASPGFRIPYRDFPVEYPPLPLVLMLAPRLVVRTLAGYRLAFGGLTGLLYLLCAGLAARLVTVMGTLRGFPNPPATGPAGQSPSVPTRPGTLRGFPNPPATGPAGQSPSVPTCPGTRCSGSARAWRRMGWLALAIGPLVCARFDLLPAVLVVTALAALARRWTFAAAISLGLAGLSKLYPFLLLLPITAFLWGAEERRRAVVLALGAAFTAVLFSLPFLVLAPAAFVKSVALYGARPLQVESLLGCIVLAVRGKAAVVGSFGSFNVVTPGWLGRVADVVFFFSLVALGAAALVSGRRSRSLDAGHRLRGLVLWTCGSIAVVLCTSKVLSPQFILWLVPLPVLVGESRAPSVFLWTVVAAALTQVFYPTLYGFFLDGRGFAVGIVLARNTVLVALAGQTLRAAWRNARPATPGGGSPLQPPSP